MGNSFHFNLVSMKTKQTIFAIALFIISILSGCSEEDIEMIRFKCGDFYGYYIVMKKVGDKRDNVYCSIMKQKKTSAR